MYRHVIWDFDGTLFDTYPVMATFLQKMLRGQGQNVAIESILEAMKISAKTAYEKYGLDADAISRFKVQKAQAELKSAQPFTDIPQLCRFIQKHDGHNYILTHRGASTFKLLQANGLTGVFRDVVTAERGFARKPDPAAIQYLMKHYQMEPAETIMIGDRELDVQSGHQAGINSCLVADMPADQTVATYVVSDMKDLAKLIF